MDGDVDLNRADNPWKPSMMLETNSKTDKLQKAVRGILNKLTPQKFDVLVKQFLEVEVEYEPEHEFEEQMKACIRVIFDSAIDRPEFSVLYAYMCNHLKIPKLQGVEVDFLKILINHTQREFEASLKTNFELENKNTKLIKDEKARAEAEESYSIVTSRARRRCFGNIQFIGALYMLKILGKPIVHECIKKLLGKKADKLFDLHDELSLECLCRLLLIVGKDLDHGKGKSKMASYFKEIESIIEGRKTESSRVRFLLMDLVELRKRQWVPRFDYNGPNTIDQICKDFERDRSNLRFLDPQAWV